MQAQGQAPQLQPFAMGTTVRPAPVGSLTYAAGQTQTFKIPRYGFLGKLKLEFAGQAQYSVAGTAAAVPAVALIGGYSLKNSLGYAYRDLDGDSLAFANEIRYHGSTSPVTGSPSYEALSNTSTALQSFAFVLDDMIGMNEGLNFDSFLISCQTNDNEIVLSITWAAESVLNVGGATISTVTGTLQISAYYYTVPQAGFALPDTSMVQQYLSDPTFTTVVAGLNSVPLIPVQGPEYIGIGAKVVTNGVPDPTNYATNIVGVDLLAGGVDVIRQWTAQDLIDDQFKKFGRALPAGWLYWDYLDDVGLVNATGPIQRLAFNTSSYSDMRIRITLASGTNVTANNVIKLMKRMQSQVVA